MSTTSPPRYRAEVLMALTPQSPICPPSTQFAVSNAIRSKKSRLIYQDFSHGTPSHSPRPDQTFPFLTFQTPSL
jgi:cephalosporin-C deacetylase-like acetyl esterase